MVQTEYWSRLSEEWRLTTRGERHLNVNINNLALVARLCVLQGSVDLFFIIYTVQLCTFNLYFVLNIVLFSNRKLCFEVAWLDQAQWLFTRLMITFSKSGQSQVRRPDSPPTPPTPCMKWTLGSDAQQPLQRRFYIITRLDCLVQMTQWHWELVLTPFYFKVDHLLKWSVE